MNDAVSAAKAFEGLLDFLMFTYRAVLRLGDLLYEFFGLTFNELMMSLYDIESNISSEWANIPIVVAVFYLVVPLAVTGFIWNLFFKVLDRIFPFA